MAEEGIPFTKGHGNENDFVFFIRERCPESIKAPEFIQRVCDRHAGVGADGILILSEPEEGHVDFVLDYYNADGTWETLCANGSRCAVKLFAREKNRVGKFTFLAGDGTHEAELLGDTRVRMQMRPPHFVTESLVVMGYQGKHVDSGAPHFVVPVPEATEDLASREGPPIRHSQEFLPRGVNVNFLQRIDASTLKVVSYEKGVEAVMRSCCSGSVAASYHAHSDDPLASPVRIINPGGELTVEFDPQWQEVYVTGPAVLVFDGELPAEF